MLLPFLIRYGRAEKEDREEARKKTEMRAGTQGEATILKKRTVVELRPDKLVGQQQHSTYISAVTSLQSEVRRMTI